MRWNILRKAGNNMTENALKFWCAFGAIIGIILAIPLYLSVPTFIVLLVLKLCSVLTCSWVIVFIPIMVFVATLITTVIISVFGKNDD